MENINWLILRRSMRILVSPSDMRLLRNNPIRLNRSVAAAKPKPIQPIVEFLHIHERDMHMKAAILIMAVSSIEFSEKF